MDQVQVMQGRIENENKLNDAIIKRLKSFPLFLTTWHNTLIAAQKKGSTRKTYIDRISTFLSACFKNPKDITPDDITYDIFLNYWINKTDISKSTGSSRATLWYSFRSFFDFMIEQGYMTKDYLKGIPKPKQTDLISIQKKRKTADSDDLYHILNYMDCVTENEFLLARDTVLLLTLMTTGIRESALISINVSDIDFDKDCILIYDKGQIPRECHIIPRLREALNEYLPMRNEKANENTDALFINLQGNRISRGGVIKLTKKYSREALGVELSPHSFRSSYVTIVQNESGDANFTRIAVGHTNIATTLRYFNPNNRENITASNIMANSIFGSDENTTEELSDEDLEELRKIMEKDLEEQQKAIEEDDTPVDELTDEYLEELKKIMYEGNAPISEWSDEFLEELGAIMTQS